MSAHRAPIVSSSRKRIGEKSRASVSTCAWVSFLTDKITTASQARFNDSDEHHPIRASDPHAPPGRDDAPRCHEGAMSTMRTKKTARRGPLRGERRDPTQSADGVSKRQNQKRRKRSPDDVQLPTSPGAGGRAGAGSGTGRRAGAGSGAGRRAGVSTRRSEHAPDGANGKRPLPAPAYDARDRCILVRAWHLGASRCILVRARHHDRA